MSQLFQRKPIAALVEDTEGAHGLKRSLGAGDLIMLAIGAVIGAGIFGAIGTAAAGQIGPNGEVIRMGAGPALVFSFLLLGGACALAGLCYAELAAMIPQAGSAYAYSYATLGELVAWIIGWDLILEYAVGNVAVAISWGDYFNTLLRGFGVQLPVWLTTGYRTALLSSDPQIHGLLDLGAARRRHPDPDPSAGVRDRDADHLAAAARRARKRDRATTSWWSSSCSRSRSSFVVGATHLHAENYTPFAPNGFTRHSPGRRDRVLRLHRLRRDLDRGGRDEEPAAQPADRHPRRPGDLHADLRHRRVRADRHGAVQGARGGRPAGARARAGGFKTVGWIVALGAAISMSAVLLVFQYGQPRIFFAMGRDGLLPAVGGARPPGHQDSRDDDDHHRRLRRACGRSSATRRRPTT